MGWCNQEIAGAFFSSRISNPFLLVCETLSKHCSTSFDQAMMSLL